MEKRPCREENIDSSEARHASDDSEDASSSESEPEEQQQQQHQRVRLSSRCKKREPLAVAKPHRQLCRSPCLDRPSFSQGSTAQDLRDDDGSAAATRLASDREYQTKMDFALKLGYSGEQVETVLHKLGAAALINDILAELVRLGNKVEPEVQPCSGAAASMSRPPCVKETVSPEVSVEDDSPDTFDNLRPIVIDGSNVAMR